MTSQFPPFSTARQAALELSLKSRVDYINWHKANNPPYLPRYPNRVYKEFISWNDWLGTANVFSPNVKVDWRPYWEAVKWSQAFCAEHNISTMKEWVEHPKEELPDDIPRRPDQQYDDFPQQGWKTWLGTDARRRVLTAMQRTHVIAFCSHHDLRVPGNYYSMIHAPQGGAELKEKLNSIQYKDLRVIKMYLWDEAAKEKVLAVLNHFSKDMGEGMLFIPNINALFFELDALLDWFTYKVG